MGECCLSVVLLRVIFLLEGPHGLIFVHIFLILGSLGQPEVLQELGTNVVLLYSLLLQKHGPLLLLLFLVNLAILLAEVLLKRFGFLLGKDIFGARSPRKLGQLGDQLNLEERFAENGIDTNVATFFVNGARLFDAMNNQESAKFVPNSSRLLVNSLLTSRLSELKSSLF